MKIPMSKLTSKCQATIPREVRDALDIGAGDTIVFDVDNGEVRLRKAQAVDLAFTRALEDTLAEWHSPEDEAAYDEL